jgi:hypothetical protein
MSFQDAIVELVESLIQRRFAGRHHGVAFATVRELTDQGCTLDYTSIGGDAPSVVARIATPMAGDGRGMFFRPERGDEVVVAFENGDLSQPVVIAAVWPPPGGQGSALPPGADTGATNNVRTIVSRAGHKIVLDDTPGTGAITIEAAGGGAKIELTPTGQVKITGASITLNDVSWNHAHKVPPPVGAPTGPPLPLGP